MKRISLSVLAFVLVVHLFAQNNYQPSQGNLNNRQWFQDNKFGLFVHWGVYSVMAGGGDMGIAEWIMNKKEIPINQYEKLPSFFNPTAFDADEWVSMVKKAGMRYITITSKHHDGFAMYHSKVSNYNVVEKTPYGQDIIKALKVACDKQGIKLFFYYSQLDWHHPDYFPKGKTCNWDCGRPKDGNWNNYIEYMNIQLSELLTSYGEIGGIWFDGMWDKSDADWKLEETYQLIHKHQPDALIGSNHHKSPYPGEDFQMFERDLPGENTMGFNQTGTISELPLEMCETMNGSWGFNIKDKSYKTSKQLIQTMIKAAGYGANFLLNTGPMPNGKIQPENIDTLMVMGNWLEKNGESIYNTRRGPYKPQDWGAITSNGNTHYIHILKMEGEEITIPALPSKIKKAVFLNTNKKVSFTEEKTGLRIQIPMKKQNIIDTIIKVEL